MQVTQLSHHSGCVEGEEMLYVNVGTHKYRGTDGCVITREESCVCSANAGRVRGLLPFWVTHIKTHILYSHGIIPLYGTLDKSVSEMAAGVSERDGVACIWGGG